MTKRSKMTYKRLPGSRRSLLALSMSRLYLGSDHLIAVENHRFSEDYKRFYFADIQAVVLRRTPRWLVSALAQFLAALIFLGMARLAHAVPLRVFWLFLTAAAAFFLTTNLLKGPTCVCRILTAVQEGLLPSLGRVRVAGKVIDGILKPLIDDVQGGLRLEEMTEGEAAGRITQRRYESFRAKIEGAPSTTKPYRGSFHWLAFSLLLSTGIFTIERLSITRRPS